LFKRADSSSLASSVSSSVASTGASTGAGTGASSRVAVPVYSGRVVPSPPSTTGVSSSTSSS